MMKFIYPVVLHKTEEEGYQGYFPDLECCYASGNTLMDALDDAADAAFNWITVELEDPEGPEGQLAPVSDETTIDLKEGEIFRNVMVTIRLMEGWDE